MSRLAPLLCLALAVAACHWREGNAVWVERYDRHTDADGCPSDEVSEVTPTELLGLIWDEAPGLVVVDVRPSADCEAWSVPGAQCIPLVGDHLDHDIEDLATAFLVVFYDEASAGLDDRSDSNSALLAAESTTLACDQVRAVLENGFAGWLDLPDNPYGPGE